MPRSSCSRPRPVPPTSKGCDCPTRRGHGYREGYREGWRHAHADAAIALAPRDPILELLSSLAEEASAIPEGDVFHGGPLDGASRYNVALQTIRSIIAWDHQRKEPAKDECVACAAVTDCSPQGAAGYPLCVSCYERAVLDVIAHPGAKR